MVVIIVIIVMVGVEVVGEVRMIKSAISVREQVMIETLKGVTEIGGFKVYESPENADFGVVEHDNFVHVDHAQNCIAFQIQNGPIKENGVNGCQVDTLIYAARDILRGLTETYSCTENRNAIRYLDNALQELDKRTKDRES